MSELYRQFSTSIKSLPNPITFTWQWVMGRVQGVIGKLMVAQKLYLVAILLTFMTDSFALIALLTVAGLSIEFWPVFERIWHSLAGKAVLLLFYAIVANFALGWAAGIVNDVVGVPASHLSYTHNMAILLYIPAWFVIISALAILFAQLIVPFYLMLILLVKPLGITLPRLTQNEHFRKTTLLVRLVLATTLLVYLVLYLVPEINEDETTENIQTSINSQVAEVEAGLALNENVTDEDAAAIRQATQLISDAQAKVRAAKLAEQSADDASDDSLIEELTEGVALVNESEVENNQAQPALDDEDNTREKYQKFVRKMVAEFAFNLEADSRSRCEKSPESKVVELNDYEILEIFADSSAVDGYRFEVKPCVSPAFPLASSS
ncbi:hypothetical protein [Shewanella waksmanii]|uniref:hypothetical protein n=1 Tax=Shewanella waksmanii TaxID=213783 RepID=UPI0037357B2B